MTSASKDLFFKLSAIASIALCLTVMAKTNRFGGTVAGAVAENIFGETSSLTLNDVTKSSMKPVWCEMEGGYSLMLDDERDLSKGLLVKQQVDQNYRYFHLVPEKLTMLGYTYGVEGIGFSRFGTASVTMHALHASGGADKVYEFSMFDVNALGGTRTSTGICRIDKPLDLPQMASADAYTAWSSILVSGKNYAYREMIVDGRKGVYYGIGQKVDGQHMPNSFVSIGFNPRVGDRSETSVLYLSLHEAVNQSMNNVIIQ